MGGIGFGVRNTIKDLSSTINNYKNNKRELDGKYIDALIELEKAKKDYFKELKKSKDYNPADEDMYLEKWEQFEKTLLSELKQNIEKAKTRNNVSTIISLLIKLGAGIAFIAAMYAISHI